MGGGGGHFGPPPPPQISATNGPIDLKIGTVVKQVKYKTNTKIKIIIIN